jgi:hypothetical protein
MVSLKAHQDQTGGRHREVSQDRMDILAAFRELGSYRAAADLCGTTHKTVRRILERQQQGPPPRRARRHNTAVAADVVREKVAATDGRISAKRLLPPARATGYGGSARNFRHLVHAEKEAWRRRRRVYRPWLPTPGEHLVMDWVQIGPLHIFSAVLVWSRVRFVRFALDERRETTLRWPSASRSSAASRRSCSPTGCVAAGRGRGQRRRPAPGVRPLRISLRLPARLLCENPDVESMRRSACRSLRPLAMAILCG